MNWTRRAIAGMSTVTLTAAVLIACGSGSACAAPLAPDAVTVATKGGGGSTGGSRSSGSGGRTVPPKSPTRSPSKPNTKPPSKSGSKTRPPSNNANTRPPSKISTRPAGIAKGVKAPTAKTNFGTTYKNKVTVNGHRTTHVYVYHSRTYYDTPGFLALDFALRLNDPYYYGNWGNPLSPWYHHPVLIAQSCQSNQPAPPASDRPDPAPVNVVVNNAAPASADPNASTTSSTAVPQTTTTPQGG